MVNQFHFLWLFKANSKVESGNVINVLGMHAIVNECLQRLFVSKTQRLKTNTRKTEKSGELLLYIKSRMDITLLPSRACAVLKVSSGPGEMSSRFERWEGIL